MTDILKFLTHVVSNYGYGATMMFMILGIIALILIFGILLYRGSLGKLVDKKISKKLDEDEETHKIGNRLRKDFNKNVVEILQDLAEETGADRALVFEFSNGTSNLVGMPFLFMSATAEVVTPNTSPVGHRYQKVNTSIGANFLIELEEHGYIYIENLEESKDKYPILSYFMLPNDVKSALFYSIEGVDSVIGFLVITTTCTCGRVLNKYESIPVISKAAQKIGALLNFNEISKGLKSEKKFK